MFTPKVYQLVCHGCGVFHEVVAEFMSSALSVSLPGAENASMWVVPMAGCPACMAVGKGNPDRSANPIARAFDHGMSAEARARMDAAWPDVRLKLEAKRKAEGY